MAKKKNQNSKAPRTTSTECNIGSSSLLPARSHGERPDMAFPIKREPVENDDSVAMEIDFPINNPEIADLFEGISDARNRAVLSEGDHSNHSITSTCTEPMDNGEGSLNGSHPISPSENHVMPTSFSQVLVKQEMRMPEVPSNQAECFTPLSATNIIAAGQSTVKETLTNNHVTNSFENNVVTPTINDQVKKEPIENNEYSQDISIQNVIDAPVNVKTEPTEKHENAKEFENKNNEKLPTKRKPELDAKLELLRKRLKKEPCEDDVNENETRNFSFEQNNETQQEDTPVVPLSEINGISDQVRKEMPGDNESTEDAVREEIIDHEIAVLTVPKIERNIETITLSDDEDPQNSEEQDIEMECSIVENISTSLTKANNIPSIHCNVPLQPSAESLTSQPSTSASPKKFTKQRNFSTDILSYFSVVNKLDRYDCKACLESLKKKKVVNPLNNYFPTVKVEKKSKNEIQKGDMLFKKIITETHSDTKRAPISENDNSILQNLPVQSTAQSVTRRFPTRFSSSLVPSETCSTENRAAISQNVDYNIPEKFQPTAKYPGLPTSQSALPNLFPTPTSSNFEINPSPNSWSATSNSEIEQSISIEQLQNVLSCLPNFKFPIIDKSKKVTANDQHHIGNSNQVTETTVISPRVPLGSSQTPLPNHTFQMPSYSATTTFAAAASSYSVPTTSYLPAVSSCSQETQDSRHAVNKLAFLPSSKIESSIQNRNTAVVQPQVSLQQVTTLPNNFQSLPGHSASINPLRPVTTLPNNFQSLPGHSASINSLRPATSLLSLGTRDPRTAANRVSRTQFPPRKGKKDLSLYLNVGKDYITQHFDNLILQWNPEWIPIQERTNILPPISEYYKSVVYFYSNEMDYYNTYVPLHLLHIWHNICQCWIHRERTSLKCKVQSVERMDNGFKISLSVVLENTDLLPKNDDIVWCTHNNEEAFLRVEDVKRKNLESGVKLRMTLYTLHDLHLNFDDEVTFSILYNTRAAYLQTEALNSLDNSMKELVLKPTDLLSRIEIVHLNNNKKIKEQRDDILKVVVMPQIRVVVIDTYYNHDSVLLLTQVAYNILLTFNTVFSEKHKSKNQVTTKKQSKVLIILKNDQLLERLYKSLSQYEPILAVRTKQINLSPDLVRHTIEDRLEKNASEKGSKECISRILQEHHIFLTTVSAFGSTEKNLLSKMRDLICIIDDAHLCTEVETALPLTLKISKLLLIGTKDRFPLLPSALMDYKYHVTLFVRLMKAKRRL